jgi:DNA-binding NtrC family response regulator
VRELAHVLKAAAALTGDGPIEASTLDLETSDAALPASDYHREVDDFRRAILRRALAAHGGNRAAAARQLGVSRQALSYLVRELGLADEPES